MGASLFKSPNIGESHHQFRGHKNNWQPENHGNASPIPKNGTSFSNFHIQNEVGQTPHHPPRQNLEEAKGTYVVSGTGKMKPSDHSKKSSHMSEKSLENLSKYLNNNQNGQLTQQQMDMMPSFGFTNRFGMVPQPQQMDE